MSGLQLHERYFIVRKAAGDLGKAVIDLLEKHDLTYLEWCSILAEQIEIMTKYGIRAERHPDDSDKKGDEA